MPIIVNRIIIVDIPRDKIIPENTVPYEELLRLFASLLAIVREIVRGIPLQRMVVKTLHMDKAIVYAPSVDALRFHDKTIRYKNPNSRVKTLNTDRIATDFIKDLIISPQKHYTINIVFELGVEYYKIQIFTNKMFY